MEPTHTSAVPGADGSVVGRWEGPPPGRDADATVRPEDVDDVFAELYANRRVELVRLAALLLRDPATAEDVVQEAYIRCYQARGKLRDPDSALAYLRRAVVNTARSAVRRRLVAWRNAPLAMPAGASAEQLAWQRAERDAVVAALRALPPRQREAVVLRYYGDLSEIDTARAMGCSTGSVKAHTSRGLSRLAGLLEGLREERR